MGVEALCLVFLCFAFSSGFFTTVQSLTLPPLLWSEGGDLQPNPFGLKPTIKDTLICNYLRLVTQSYISSTISCTVIVYYRPTMRSKLPESCHIWVTRLDHFMGLIRLFLRHCFHWIRYMTSKCLMTRGPQIVWAFDTSFSTMNMPRLPAGRPWEESSIPGRDEIFLS
jgi:hypothetical protein